MAVRVRSLPQYVTLAQYLKIAQPLTTRIPPPPKPTQKHLERVFTVSIQKSLKNYVFGSGRIYEHTAFVFARGGATG
jgi:hypothetical protein